MRMRVPGCRAGVPPFSCRSSPCRVLPRKMSEGLEEGRPLECSLLHTQPSAAAPSRVFQRSLHGFARARTPKASARGFASNRSMTIDVRLGGKALWQPRRLSPLPVRARLCLSVVSALAAFSRYRACIVYLSLGKLFVWRPTAITGPHVASSTAYRASGPCDASSANASSRVIAPSSGRMRTSVKPRLRPYRSTEPKRAMRSPALAAAQKLWFISMLTPARALGDRYDPQLIKPPSDYRGADSVRMFVLGQVLVLGR